MAAVLVASSTVGLSERPPSSAFPHCFACRALMGRALFSRQHELDFLRTRDVEGVRLSLNSCRLLSRAVPPAQSIAVGGIGALGYCFRGRVIDFFGLTDATIARTRVPPAVAKRAWPLPGHQRSNARYVLGQKPDFLMIPQRGTPFFLVPAVVDLWDQPDLDRLYVWDPTMRAYRLRLRGQARAASQGPPTGRQ